MGYKEGSNEGYSIISVYCNCYKLLFVPECKHGPLWSCLLRLFKFQVWSSECLEYSYHTCSYCVTSIIKVEIREVRRSFWSQCCHNKAERVSQKLVYVSRCACFWDGKYYSVMNTCCALENYVLQLKKTKKLNFMAWVRERTIPTERPPLVGKVIANVCG
jgi:hypothetical protein